MHRLVQLILARAVIICILNSPSVNTKTGKDAGRSFYTLNRRYHSGRNPRTANDDGLRYFIEVYGTRGKGRVAILGVDDEDALNSTRLLAIIYSLEGKYEEAEQLEV
ncbi:hypothetical protein N7474_006265 [Penicillium riverlandense]|uniref:uncharacterized protein n=1 Tax=Penicillium riverlandense TaxID=1903569 RepID=UPI00254765F5|nr:uncharacterized protein N7474_006265 [Penicillium riverlandense]KAJ5814488.1 hypothetical protein N7474_006265 [Penicillium riverlandense]